LAGNAALFQGDYKLVRNYLPVGDNRWHLYNIATDPGETQDLSESMPERFELMQTLYADYAAANGVLPVPAGYDATFQGVANGLRERFGSQILLAMLTLLVLIPFYFVYRVLSRR